MVIAFQFAFSFFYHLSLRVLYIAARVTAQKSDLSQFKMKMHPAIGQKASGWIRKAVYTLRLCISIAESFRDLSCEGINDGAACATTG